MYFLRITKKRILLLDTGSVTKLIEEENVATFMMPTVRKYDFRTKFLRILDNNLGILRLEVATMKRKMESNASKPASAKKHWSAGLLNSMEDPESKVREDDKTVVIKDKYPKAKFHYLVLPKEDIPTIWHVKGKHHDLLMHMHNIARSLAEKHTDHEFIIGYHAVPSMKRLHLHVISTDFVSPCLKTKYHWNSFTTPFFLPSSDICRQLRETGELRRIPPEESEGHLTTELKCYRCATRLKNMPQLKKHLLTHVNK